jgi:hypothetical protein
MRKVTHEFDWQHVLTALIQMNPENFEDGFWQLGVVSQNFSTYTSEDPSQPSFPTNIQRVIGVHVQKVYQWWPNTIYLEKGVIQYGPSSDNVGLIEVDQSSGETS